VIGLQDYWRQRSANSSIVACRTANPTSFLRPVVGSASLLSATANFWRLAIASVSKDIFFLRLPLSETTSHPWLHVARLPDWFRLAESAPPHRYFVRRKGGVQDTVALVICRQYARTTLNSDLSIPGALGFPRLVPMQKPTGMREWGREGCWQSSREGRAAGDAVAAERPQYGCCHFAAAALGGALQRPHNGSSLAPAECGGRRGAQGSATAAAAHQS